MKVGARITLSSAALVAVTLAAFALLDLRASATERRARFEETARQMGQALRAALEARDLPSVLADADATSKELSRSSGWTIALMPSSSVTQAVHPSRRGQQRRLGTLLDVRPHALETRADGRYNYALPLRVQSQGRFEDYKILGSVEVSRPFDSLNASSSAELRRTLTVLVVIVSLTVLALMLITRTVVTRPIEKLLEGIDEVAQGDLSRVLLSEHDDEVGALADRFNEMTFSLRESRSEMARHSEAKLSLEHRLSHTEKLATIGQLAAEIAHEVGTPLNVIAGRARGMAKKAREPEVVERHARIIAEQTDRITRIIQRLMDLTRRKVGDAGHELVNLNAISLTTMEFLAGKLSAGHIKTVLDRAEGLPPVLGDPDRLQQVLINLLLNAAEAMADGGVVRLETSLVERKRPGLERAAEQRYVLLTIADTGPGIPEEIRGQIFQPFYTSKKDSGGTGLGLAVCRGIVKEHDGWMEVADAKGGGTVFQVYLPAQEREDASGPVLRRDLEPEDEA